MSNRVRKTSEGTPQKTGPMKATIPMSSLCRGSLSGGSSAGSRFTALSPPMRHISPEHNVSGHRSPGALTYKANPCKPADIGIRRTASLDALYSRPSSAFFIPQSTILQLHKATQTEESYVDRVKVGTVAGDFLRSETPTDYRVEKVLRQRVQKTGKGAEHSVSSQTLSPVHVKASPVLIPVRPMPTHSRPMRNSVEGLNQEIEKLVLLPGQPHTCRPEINLFSRGTPEGYPSPLTESLIHSSILFPHGDTRSVNTQTPSGDHLSSDESQSTSPEDGASSTTGASPRINRFLAREPPDGCEKVCLKPTDTDHPIRAPVFKPCFGFELKPSVRSAFQPLQPSFIDHQAIERDDPAEQTVDSTIDDLEIEKDY